MAMFSMSFVNNIPMLPHPVPDVGPNSVHQSTFGIHDSISILVDVLVSVGELAGGSSGTRYFILCHLVFPHAFLIIICQKAEK